MSSDFVFDAVHDFLEATWDTGAVPMKFENEGGDPPNPPVPWIQVEMAGNIYEAASIGAGDDQANLYREDG